MNNKRRNSVSTTVILVTFFGMQGTVFAGRIDSSIESAEHAQRLDKRPAVKDREHLQARVVHNNVTSDSGADGSRDARLADYLEMHGRVVEGSIRSTMMPWSALQQVAN